jgi:predicted metalloprotease
VAGSARWRRADVEHPRRTRAITLLCVTVGVLLSACGSSGRPSSASIEGSEISRLAALTGPAVGLTAHDLSTTSGQTSFLDGVFADLEAAWKQSFGAGGLPWVPARLDLIDAEVSTPCGKQTLDVGPIYCQRNHTVYLSVGFFKHLELLYEVSGQVAEAYVVAHEFGHQVQNELAISSRLAAADRADPAHKNTRSVSFELQADCLAGVWVRSAYRRSVTPLELKEALAAAQVLGDDYAAHAAESTVDANSWTHGSSAQREHWVKAGYEGDRAGACNTFSGSEPG